METFQKTDKEIKNQIINWFLKYHGMPIDNFNGQEEFTLFDKISLDKQKVINALSLNNELPVLVLKKTTRISLYAQPDAFFTLKKMGLKN